MKKALRRGGYGALNIYFQSNLTSDPGSPGGSVLLGYCTLPTKITYTWNGQTYTYPASDYATDGCNVLAGSMPGSPNAVFGYDRGKTAVHEVGHWFGLLHTFQVSSGFSLPSSSCYVCSVMGGLRGVACTRYLPTYPGEQAACFTEAILMDATPTLTHEPPHRRTTPAMPTPRATTSPTPRNRPPAPSAAPWAKTVVPACLAWMPSTITWITRRTSGMFKPLNQALSPRSKPMVG